MESPQKSTHRVEIVPVELRPHPNADSLSLVTVWGYTAIVRTADWLDREVGAFIPPDSIVPADDPAYAFLNGHRRIKAKKLRGVQSWGLLVPAPDGTSIGDDVADMLQITHYEPPTRGESQSPNPPRQRDFAKFDVDAMLRYHYLFTPGEPVVATEKIHGANCRVVCDAEGMHVGSRNLWVKDEEGSIYWRAVKKHLGIERYLHAHENIVIYGEVFGWVQDLRYGADERQKQVWFTMFDINTTERWLNHEEVEAIALEFEIPMAPVLYSGPFDLEALKVASEGPSTMLLAKHVREGVVVRPAVERWDERLGRVILKLVNPAYLEKAK